MPIGSRNFSFGWIAELRRDVPVRRDNRGSIHYIVTQRFSCRRIRKYGRWNRPSKLETGEAIMTSDTLYHRLGGYDAIVAVVDDLLARLKADAQLGRFWQHRGEDGVLRERQLLINFLCSSAGGPLMYVGRDMKTAHKGMGINDGDWQAYRSC